MEDFLYAYNQPKQFGKYDLFLDGKITANEVVYKILTEEGEYQNIDVAEKVKEIEGRLQTHFTFEHVDVLPTEGKETVIYLVPNDKNSGDKDSYDEYMWVKKEETGEGVFELIGSGTYAQQKAELEAESNRAKAAEETLTKNLAQEVTDRKGVDSALDEKIEKRVVINDPITITDKDKTTSITSDTISTTTLTGTLDAESMKNSLTAEAVQTVAPIAFGEWTLQPDAFNKTCAIAIGHYARTKDTYSLAIGSSTRCDKSLSVAVGHNTQTIGLYSLSAGVSAVSKSDQNITIGFGYKEKVDNEEVPRNCTTEGTGSITIGAGANTINTKQVVNGKETTVESSNSVTIGCKAENKGADSVVLGASSNNAGAGNVVIGGEAVANGTCNVNIGYKTNKMTGSSNVAIGYYTNSGDSCVSIGSFSTAGNNGVAVGRYSHGGTFCVALGDNVKAAAAKTIAIGANATISDLGATVIRSTAQDDTVTQLYFSGANTPLALKYYPTEWEKKQDVDEQGNPKVDENGEPVMVDDKDKPTKGQAMMGYVVSKVVTEIVDGEEVRKKEILECGTNLLAALFPNHGLGDNPFQPTTTAIDGEEIMSFHPSDLDLSIEDTPIEEEYKPLPIYPIVETTE